MSTAGVDRGLDGRRQLDPVVEHGGLTGDDEGAWRPPAQALDQSEHGCGVEGAPVDGSGPRQRAVAGVQDRERSRGFAPLHGVDQHEGAAAVEHLVGEVDAADAGVEDADVRRQGLGGEAPGDLDAEPVVGQEHVPHTRGEHVTRHRSLPGARPRPCRSSGSDPASGAGRRPGRLRS